mgnify:CR=1 FL=1
MQNQKQVILKAVKIMSKNIENKVEDNWEISVGTYNGVLFGIRRYEDNENNIDNYVLYLPFVDICLTVKK